MLGKSFDKASFKLIRNLQIHFSKINELIGERGASGFQYSEKSCQQEYRGEMGTQVSCRRRRPLCIIQEWEQWGVFWLPRRKERGDEIRTLVYRAARRKSYITDIFLNELHYK